MGRRTQGLNIVQLQKDIFPIWFKAIAADSKRRQSARPINCTSPILPEVS